MMWRPLRPAGSSPLQRLPPENSIETSSTSAGRFRLVPQAGSCPGRRRARIGEGNQIAVLAQTRREPSERKTGRPIELCRDAFSDRCATATHGGRDRKRPPSVPARCRQARLAHNARPGLQRIPPAGARAWPVMLGTKHNQTGAVLAHGGTNPSADPEKRGHGPTPTQTAAAGDPDPDLGGAGGQRPMGASSAPCPAYTRSARPPPTRTSRLTRPTLPDWFRGSLVGLC